MSTVDTIIFLLILGAAGLVLRDRGRSAVLGAWCAWAAITFLVVLLFCGASLIFARELLPAASTMERSPG